MFALTRKKHQKTLIKKQVAEHSICEENNVCACVSMSLYMS